MIYQIFTEFSAGLQHFHTICNIFRHTVVFSDNLQRFQIIYNIATDFSDETQHFQSIYNIVRHFTKLSNTSWYCKTIYNIFRLYVLVHISLTLSFFRNIRRKNRNRPRATKEERPVAPAPQSSLLPHGLDSLMRNLRTKTQQIRLQNPLQPHPQRRNPIYMPFSGHISGKNSPELGQF